MSEIKNGRLDQYGTEPFEQQKFGTAGVEGVKTLSARTPLCVSISEIAHHPAGRERTIVYTQVTSLMTCCYIRSIDKEYIN